MVTRLDFMKPKQLAKLLYIAEHVNLPGPWTAKRCKKANGAIDTEGMGCYLQAGKVKLFLQEECKHDIPMQLLQLVCMSLRHTRQLALELNFLREEREYQEPLLVCGKALVDLSRGTDAEVAARRLMEQIKLRSPE